VSFGYGGPGTGCGVRRGDLGPRGDQWLAQPLAVRAGPEGDLVLELLVVSTDPGPFFLDSRVEQGTILPARAGPSGETDVPRGRMGLVQASPGPSEASKHQPVLGGFFDGTSGTVSGLGRQGPLAVEGTGRLVIGRRLKPIDFLYLGPGALRPGPPFRQVW